MQNVWQKAKQVIAPKAALKSRFSHIYQDNGWGGNESVSGRGSDLDQTIVIREELPQILRKIQAKSLLDAPCGDFHWMKEISLTLERYIGGDIVPELIAKNQERYGSAHRQFFNVDITRDRLPQVDIILCRDCLVHLSPKQAMTALRNFKSSGSVYLLSTTFLNATEQNNNTTADWHPLNLTLAPFNLPEPEMLINEQCPEAGAEDKCLGLWKLADVPL